MLICYINSIHIVIIGINWNRNR